MAYKSLRTGSATPKRVLELVHHLDISFADVHCMLRLPIANYNLTAGCNYAITHVLMSAIGGVSTTLYSQKGKVGERFVGVLADFYPWDLEPSGSLPIADAADTIYSIFRNPLTHDLGLDVKQKAQGRIVKVKRLTTKTRNGAVRGLPESQIEQIETAIVRPDIGATVTGTDQKTVLLVEALYWGVRVMIERLLADHQRIADAEAFLENL